MKIQMGVDPEVFLRKGNDFICAWGVIPGDKENPYKVNRGAVQVDGFALEFNIDPVNTEQDFVLSINEVFHRLQEMVAGVGDVVITPVAPFSLDYIQAQDPKARELGCDPDFNAWENGKQFPAPCGDRPFRTGAGHVHIGWTENENPRDEMHMQKCIALTKQLDFFLGLPSVILDEDKIRKQMYGKAGCFRPKSYGLEYRTLSNFWLQKEEWIRLIYKNSHLALQRLIVGDAFFREKDIQYIINEGNKDKAEELCLEYGIPMRI